MRVEMYKVDSPQDVGWGGDPWHQRNKREAIELAFTDTRHPTSYRNNNKLFLYVQDCNLDIIDCSKEADIIYDIGYEEVVSSPFRTLEDEVESNRENYEHFFELENYADIDEILRASSKIPSEPGKAITKHRIDHSERRWRPWAETGLLRDSEKIPVGPESEVVFLGLSENYRTLLEM